jgi:hypothetical protein
VNRKCCKIHYVGDATKRVEKVLVYILGMCEIFMTPSFPTVLYLFLNATADQTILPICMQDGSYERAFWRADNKKLHKEVKNKKNTTEIGYLEPNQHSQKTLN